MPRSALDDFRATHDEWRDELASLRQNSLLSESSFIDFARDRRVPVQGLIEGEPGEFYRRGWLEADEIDEEGKPRFHLFGCIQYTGSWNETRRSGGLQPPGTQSF